MPANRIAMRRIREVLRLKHECALPNARIAAALGIAKGSVANYLAAATGAGLTHSEAQALDDAALNARLHPQRYVYPQFAVPDFGEIHRELRRKGVTLQLLWEEYRAQAQGVPYSRSRFCERYIEFRQRLRRSMRQIHVAGEKLFVDYAGPTVPLIDPASGEITRAHIFVAVWGASNYTYVEATAAESKADWIAAHVNALTFFGGAPALLVPDNPRALIRDPDRYEPIANRTYEALAEHYGCAILPARPRKPQDKAKVEAAGLQGAEPVRKSFVLGKDLFINLPSLDASLFAEEAGFSSDVKVLVVSSQLPANLGDLCRRFEEREEQFIARKACRALRVLEKKYAGLLGDKGLDFSSFGASAGASRLHYANLSVAESNLAAYALLNALQPTKASPLIAYAHRGTRVSGQLASLLSSLATKGYKLAVSLDSAINPAFLGEGIDRIDCLLPSQAVLSQGDKNKTRFSPRPPL